MTELLEEHWVRRYKAPRSSGFDADSVFNSKIMLAFCGAIGSECRSGPGGAHWSRGKMERKNMVVGYIYRRLARMFPKATKKQLIRAVEDAIGNYPIKDGLTPDQHVLGLNARAPSLFDEDDCQLTGGDEGSRKELQRLAGLLIRLAECDSRFRRALSANVRVRGTDVKQGDLIHICNVNSQRKLRGWGPQGRCVGRDDVYILVNMGRSLVSAHESLVKPSLRNRNDALADWHPPLALPARDPEDKEETENQIPAVPGNLLGPTLKAVPLER